MLFNTHDFHCFQTAGRAAHVEIKSIKSELCNNPVSGQSYFDCPSTTEADLHSGGNVLAQQRDDPRRTNSFSVLTGLLLLSDVIKSLTPLESGVFWDTDVK